MQKTNAKELSKDELASFSSLLNKVPKYQTSCNTNKGTTFTIRNALAKDVTDIMTVLLTYWPEGSEYSKAKREVEAALESVEPIMLVAEQNNKVIGFVYGYKLAKDKLPMLTNYVATKPDMHASYIDELGIEPESKRQGIAGQLLDSYKEIAKRNNVDELILITMNPNAMELYKKKHYLPILDPISHKEIKDHGDDNAGIYHYLHLTI